MSPIDLAADAPTLQHGDGREEAGIGAQAEVGPTSAKILEFSLRAGPNPSCVDFCRDVLRRAEAGEISFVAVLCALPNGDTLDGWSDAEHVRPFQILGGLTCLQHKFVHRSIEGFGG